MQAHTANLLRTNANCICGPGKYRFSNILNLSAARLGLLGMWAFAAGHQRFSRPAPAGRDCKTICQPRTSSPVVRLAVESTSALLICFADLVQSSVFQSLMVLSQPPETKRLPSAEKATEATQPE